MPPAAFPTQVISLLCYHCIKQQHKMFHPEHMTAKKDLVRNTPLKHLKGYALALLIVAVVISAFITIDILASLLYSVTKNTVFSKKQLQDRLSAVVQTQNTDVLGANTTAETARHILHPYLGFVADPEKNPGINQLGWIGPNPVGKNSADTIRIIIFGGSVAQQLYEASADSLTNKLKSDERFADKKIEVFNAALSGYKQPQQLEALTYLLSMGSEYNIIINLDGFNELALPYAENWKNRVAINYPRGWNFYAKKTVNNTALDAMINLEEIRSKRKELASLFNTRLVKDNMTSLLVWNILDRNNRIAEYEHTQILSDALAGDAPSYQTHGPTSDATDGMTVLEKLADTWYNSSVQMARISTANHSTYLHFLQPNQYVPNSKRFTDQERKSALAGTGGIDENNIHQVNAALFNEAVINGYPMLQHLGQKLREQQIRFYDLTLIYQHTAETIYKDSCCHVNEEGNERLITAIAEIIRKEYLP